MEKLKKFLLSDESKGIWTLALCILGARCWYVAGKRNGKDEELRKIVDDAKKYVGTPMCALTKIDGKDVRIDYQVNKVEVSD